MPILRYKNKLAHFAHIPKCGGTSVEAYLMKVNIAVGFLDSYFMINPAPQKWNISSPQHVDGYSLSRLFPKKFFDAYFAVTRDPFTRFISAYRMAQESEQISIHQNINDFVKSDLDCAVNDLGRFDNHFRSQTSFLIPNESYKFFKLENGLNNVKDFIDLTFLGSRHPAVMLHTNKASKVKTDYTLSDKSKAKLKIIYAEDFKNFSY